MYVWQGVGGVTYLSELYVYKMKKLHKLCRMMVMFQSYIWCIYIQKERKRNKSKRVNEF